MEKDRNRIRMSLGIGSTGIVRAALAALAIATLASVPHADAQRRPVGTRGAAAQAQASASQTSEPRESAAPGEGVVNIQTATVEELQRLPGIGPAKAAAIVAQRERSPFRRIEDVLRVRGIGRATFRRLRPMLTVSGPTTFQPAQSARRPSRAQASDDRDVDAMLDGEASD